MSNTQRLDHKVQNGYYCVRATQIGDDKNNNNAIEMGKRSSI